MTEADEKRLVDGLAQLAAHVLKLALTALEHEKKIAELESRRTEHGDNHFYRERD